MLRPTAASGVMQVFPKDRLEGTAGDPANEEKRKKQIVHAKSWRDRGLHRCLLLAHLGGQYRFRTIHPRRPDSSLTNPRIFSRSGRLDTVVAAVQALLSAYLVLELEEVTLVDVEAVRFLGMCESEGIQLRHCSGRTRVDR
jgi:hypothetical protein